MKISLRKHKMRQKKKNQQQKHINSILGKKTKIVEISQNIFYNHNKCKLINFLIKDKIIKFDLKL